ncbi:hypothetical protein L484_008103 [Morus notabilis]|uniref:Uncharacterized protein n=1 Tax=Morus notabilis TaxID=981085 RepID=W9R176_9ROSA|nr:hypothetical protein L484_008103 [Morus notabilis]
MGECSWWFHTIWSSEVQLFLSSVVLFKVVGYGALPGLVPLHNRNCEFKWLAEAQLKKVRVYETVAYVSQTSWMHSGTTGNYVELLEAGTTFEQLVNAKENLKRDTWFGRRRVMVRTPLNKAVKGRFLQRVYLERS